MAASFLSPLAKTWWRIYYSTAFVHAFRTFWQRYPALFFGLSLLLGSGFALSSHFFFLLLLGLLCFTRGNGKGFLLGISLATGAYLYTLWAHPALTLSEESLSGQGRFHITQVRTYASFFTRSLLYKGTLIDFQDVTGKRYPSLPCRLYLPLQDNPPSAHTDYLISGRLQQKGPHDYVLKPQKQTPWLPLPSFPNLSQWRFITKQALHDHLSSHIKDRASCALLYTLISGETEEKLLSLEFGRVGLQHLLGVSGFHFSLLALLIRGLLSPFFSRRTCCILLILLLSFYYLFLGPSPAVQRAYVAILLASVGQLFHYSTSGLNALGIGLIVEILLDPLNILDLGFQLSFLCTYALLHVYPMMEVPLLYLFPRRCYTDALQLSFFQKHAYLLCVFLRKALALNLAVHLVSLPFLLFFFHKFPLMSLIYNLLIPSCFTLSLTLLFLALLLTPLFPPLATLLHSLNNFWTSLSLNYTSHLPLFFDVSLRSSHCSLNSALSVLCICFIAGVLFAERETIP